MKKTEKIKTLASLLSRALNVTSGVNGHQIENARMHIRMALEQVEKQGKTLEKRDTNNKNLSKEWWGNVMSGVTKTPVANTGEGPLAEQATMRALKQLDAMLKTEYDKLKELEAQTQEPPQEGFDTEYEILSD